MKTNVKMDTKTISETDLIRYFDGEATDAERTEIEAWMSASDRNRKIAEQLRYITFAADTLHVMQSVDVDAARKSVHRRIAESRRRRIFSLLQRAAAVLFLPLAGLSAWLLADRYAAEPAAAEFVELRTAAGMVSAVTLPDGTEVWLNSGSYLKYPTRFVGDREVELVGEAYFKVAKDGRTRFGVETRDMRIEVTGTEFDIDAYDDASRSVKTTLVEGSIELHYNDMCDRARVVKMKPDQCAVLDGGTVVIENVNVESAVSWREGRIVLDRTPLADALRMIENRFNVRFDVKNAALYEHRFTGVFVEQRLDTILEHFKYSSHMRFERRNSGGGASLTERETIEVY